MNINRNNCTVIGNYKINNLCLISLPCQHYITNTKTKKSESLNGHQIYELLKADGLSHTHFDAYANYIGKYSTTTTKEEQEEKEKEEHEKEEQENKKYREKANLGKQYRASSQLRKYKNTRSVSFSNIEEVSLPPPPNTARSVSVYNIEELSLPSPFNTARSVISSNIEESSLPLHVNNKHILKYLRLGWINPLNIIYKYKNKNKNKKDVTV